MGINLGDGKSEFLIYFKEGFLFKIIEEVIGFEIKGEYYFVRFFCEFL